VVQKVVEKNPSQSIPTLLVCKSFFSLSDAFLAAGVPECFFFLNVNLY